MIKSDYEIYNPWRGEVYNGILEDDILYVLDAKGEKKQLRNFFFEDPIAGRRCVFSYNKLFGYASTLSGHIELEPQWEGAEEFSYGCATVMMNGKYGVIDFSGSYISGPQWDKVVLYFLHGGISLVTLAAVCKDGKWGFIDERGNIVVAPQFDDIDEGGWYDDEASSKNVTVAIFGKKIELAVCPNQLLVARKGRWYRVQVDIDSSISVLKGKRPKKNKDIQEAER